jgi:hypothetical protein
MKKVVHVDFLDDINDMLGLDEFAVIVPEIEIVRSGMMSWLLGTRMERPELSLIVRSPP